LFYRQKHLSDPVATTCELLPKHCTRLTRV